MAAVQAEDVRASFLSVGDLNGHHQEWLGSATTNRHGVAAFDFTTVSGCDQLVVGPTHARFETLDERIVTYRRTLEGFKFFTCYLEPSVCWKIFY